VSGELVPARARPDVLAVGNAIVDVLARVDDAFVAGLGLERGTMRLVDDVTAARLRARLAEAACVAGGAAANTAVGVASLGGRAGLVATVGDDRLGRAYVEDLASAGVLPRVRTVRDGRPTGSSVVLVSPDGERTMCTHLGAAAALGPKDLFDAASSGARIVYLEGYLLDLPGIPGAVRAAAEAARAGGSQVALSLADPGCVERHRDTLRGLVASGLVDVVFANEAEIALVHGARSFEEAVAATRRLPVLAALTRGAAGSVVVRGGWQAAVPARPVATVVDTTGAGDLFAAGFLFGLLRGADPVACAELGALAAAEVVSHVGARPQRRLADLLAEAAAGS
jgi:sugar/nucleoside kinase (ribokinase family)